MRLILILIVFLCISTLGFTEENNSKKIVKQPVFDGSITYIYNGKKKTISGLPKFSDYPSEKPFEGTLFPEIDWHPPPPVGDNGLEYELREKLQNSYKHNGVNFDGRYSLSLYGCGTNCAVFQIIDPANGKIIKANVPSGYFWAEGHVDSALIISNLPSADILLNEDLNVFSFAIEVTFSHFENRGLKKITSVYLN